MFGSADLDLKKTLVYLGIHNHLDLYLLLYL